MAEKTRYSATDLTIKPLEPEDDLTGFSCGNDELDNFFHKEVALCCKYKYLSAYAVKPVNSDEVLAMFTLSNDVVTLDEEDIETLKDVVADEYKYIFSHQSSFPAINIGHLAVRADLQSRGIGRIVILYLLGLFIPYRITGVQFITVDSLNNPRTNKFYMSNGFFNQSNEDSSEKTRRMFKSLMEYI